MNKFVAECVDAAQAGCGEGPVWDHRTGLLWWVDISGETIHSYDPGSGQKRQIKAPYLISSLALSKDGLLIATAKGIARLDVDSGTLDLIHDPEPDLPGNRLNDIEVAPDGKLWAGTMSEGAKGPTGALYCYGADGPELMMRGTTISNGIGWSPDGGCLYFIDTVPGVLHRYQNGQWDILRRFGDDVGKADGLCVDSEGTLWVAICDRGEIVALDADGALKNRIQMPCDIVTSCAFGGAGLKTLFVTTGTFSMTEDEKKANPLAGGLFAIDMEVAGQQSFEALWPV